MKKNKKLILNVVIFITFLITAPAVSAASPDGDHVDLNLNLPDDAKEMKISDANGGNKIQDAVLVLDTDYGKVDYTVSKGQFYLFDLRHPNNPKYLQVKDKWVKVNRVKNLGPANCSSDSSSKKEKVAKKPTEPKTKPDTDPVPAECDPVVVDECVDRGFDKTYRSNPHVYNVSVKKVPEVRIIGGEYKGGTYARDVIHRSEYRKQIERTKQTKKSDEKVRSVGESHQSYHKDDFRIVSESN